MKGTFRIGGAIFVGVLIILGAFMVNSQKTPALNAGTAAVVVSKAPPRTAIEIYDADADGIADWEESLQAESFVEISTSSDAGTYAPPTTLTGKFSEAFLQDYLEGKMRGKDFSDPGAFVTQAIEAVETTVQSRRYTRAELSLGSSDIDRVRSYGNEVVEILNANSPQAEPEIMILYEAMEKNDPEALKELEPIKNGYRNIIDATRAMQVPDEVALSHIRLLNAYEAIFTDIEKMLLIFSDPLPALSRVNAYEQHAKELAFAFKELSDAFTERGISYRNNEPGSFFYIFDTL